MRTEPSSIWASILIIIAIVMSVISYSQSIEKSIHFLLLAVFLYCNEIYTELKRRGDK